MDKKVNEILFSLLRSELCNKEIDSEKIKNLPNDVFEQVCSILKNHDFAHMLFSPIQKYKLTDNQDIIADLKKQQMLSLIRYDRSNYEINSLSALFEEERIPFILLKGLVIRHYYPQPWMRTSSDIDVLVREEDISRAQEVIMKKLSYTFEKKGGHDVSLFSPSGVHLELHYSLIEEDVLQSADKPLQNVWNDATPIQKTNCQYELSPELFYYYHIAHMAKHFVNGGCGIKPFIDLYLMKDNLSIEEERVQNLLKEGGLLSFALHCQQLCSVWFEGDTHTDFTERLETYVLYGGMYGNLSNRVAVQQNKKGGKLGYAFSRIWLPYNVLKFHYPSLERHKALLPLYEIRRWFKLLFFKGVKRSLNELKTNQNIPLETAKETARLLNELGL